MGNNTGPVVLTAGSALGRLAEGMAKRGIAATHLVAAMDDAIFQKSLQLGDRRHYPKAAIANA